MLQALERRLEQGLRLAKGREPDLDERSRELFTAQVIGLARRYGCRVLVKSSHVGADGIHCTAADLMRMPVRPAGLAAASCHTREELERAMALGFDFAVVGPVLEKGDRQPLGWQG